MLGGSSECGTCPFFILEWVNRNWSIISNHGANLHKIERILAKWSEFPQDRAEFSQMGRISTKVE